MPTHHYAGPNANNREDTAENKIIMSKIDWKCNF